MAPRGKRKCPKCHQWKPWTEAAADGTCAACQGKQLEVDKWVIVYQKPYTDEESEGQAVLVKQIMELSDGYERWEVRFTGEEETYERTVHPRHLMV